jgi:tight adherence protein C
MTPQMLLAFGVLIVSVAVAAGYVTLEVLARRAPARQRLHDTGGSGSVLETSLPLADSALDPRLARATRYLPRSPKEMGRLRKRMARAGYHDPMAPAIYSAVELGIPVVFFLISLFVLGPTRGPFFGALIALIGYMLPGFWLSREVTKRKKAIANGLPDALDLLIVCVEAGLGLDQAIVKASEELAVSHPALAEELGILTTEVRAGKPRMEAFKNFADRTKVDEVRQLVSMLVQTDRFGTSVAQALRTQAEVSRTKRRQNAEERAAKIGVKLVFPLVFFLFPAMYVVTLGPAIIKFARFFAGMQ